jgi:hypothetical protein
MSEFTDKNIPISCGECGIYCEGFDDTLAHILEAHKNYSPEEADVYAAKWMESAYEDIDIRNQELTAAYRRNRGHKTA